MGISKKRLVSFLLLLSLLFVTGCGANITMNTEIHPDGSGVRSLFINVPGNHYGDIQGGISKLEETLKQSLPPDFTITKSTTPNDTTFIVEIPFSSIDELKEKSALITGSPVQITFKRLGTPFSHSYQLSESGNVKEYFKWAILAVRNNKLVDASENDLIQSIKNYVVLPSDHSKSLLTNNINWRATATKHYLVKNVSIETSVLKQHYSRVVTITLSAEEFSKLSKDLPGEFESYIKALSKDLNVKTTGSQFIIELQKDTPEEMKALSNSLFGPCDFGYTKIKDSSSLRPHYQFIDNFNAVRWLGEDLPLEEPVNYKVIFSATPIAPDGSIYPKGDPLRNKTQTQTFPEGNVHYSARLQEVTPLYYIAISGVILFFLSVVTIGFFSYHKKQSLINSKFKSLFTRVNVNYLDKIRNNFSLSKIKKMGCAYMITDKFSEQNKVFEKPVLDIQRNIFKTKHSIIQISNISQIWVGQMLSKPYSIGPFVLILAGFLLISLSSSRMFGLAVIGLGCIAIGGYSIYKIYEYNKKNRYALHIEMNSGGRYIVTSESVEFLNQAAVFLAETINQYGLEEQATNYFIDFSKNIIKNESGVVNTGYVGGEISNEK